LHTTIDSAHKAYVYAQIEKFSNQVLWELHEIEKNLQKIDGLSKQRDLQNVI